MNTNTKKNKFLVKFPEKSDLNQYWFSSETIKFLADQVIQNGTKIAFLSTPSVYFSLDNTDLKKDSYVFDYDKKFEKDPNFVFYDFNKPVEIPDKFFNFFDFVLIDPPFITKDVWEKYAETCKLIIKKDENNKIDGKILLSSIPENEQMLNQLLGVKKCLYKPLIPNLVYQYNFFSNYDTEILNQVNEEIGF